VTDEREPIRVGVLGARGRMGIEVCDHNLVCVGHIDECATSGGIELK